MTSFAALELAGHELTRPLGLLALSLPAILLWLSRRPSRPSAQAIGTFVLWRELGGAASGHEVRRSVPLSRWLLIASLTAGALALAGPRALVRPPRVRWRLWLDRSPSMYLPFVGPGASANERRIDRVLAELDEWRAGLDPAGFELEWEWVVRGPNGWERELGFEPPGACLQPPVPPVRELSIPPGDALPAIVITDQLQTEWEGRADGHFASGGGAVPGPVASGPEGELIWDGASLALVAAGSRGLTYCSSLPAGLIDFLALWAGDRGLESRSAPPGALAGGPSPDWTALEVQCAGTGPSEPARVARDGWILSGRARGLSASVVDRTGATRALEPWPSAGESAAGAPLVARAPGLVAIGWTEVDELAGDPVSFAVAWAELFDGALANRPQIVGIDERRAAGEPVRSPPAELARGARRSDEPPPVIPLDSWLAVAAAALAFAARMTRAS